ncbi:uncharacterized protein BDZ99DRAFT_17351 [Mytilinidion resinicola]|uniref:Protein kinase domain-containing protein n=1 Tax=Mytilinidion resinicola TaxID=574789 RepID=A0A6A6Z9V1_9PEZI|nr:uncharacterized protein BDZ99DRAFT_17351 [Mytilinidion resinicola]KAF2817513.1 hypothetical protein BDZ99DRAFT_17351 [Mytilinidion resinicola]
MKPKASLSTPPSSRSPPTRQNNLIPDEQWQESWPDKFVKIQPAGSGISSIAYYAISRQALAGLQIHQQEEHLPSIKRKICVVKIGHNALRDGIANEVKHLRLIKPAPAHPFFAELLDANTDLEHPWLATTAIVGQTLHDFRANLGPRVDDAQCFFFHLFIQLSAALCFLHEMQPFPLLHGDLHDENVMCDFQRRRDYEGLPNLVLIDFGSACVQDWGMEYEAGEETRPYHIGREACRFFQLLKEWGRRGAALEFVGEIMEVCGEEMEVERCSCTGLWQRFGRLAVEQREVYATVEVLGIVERALRVEVLENAALIEAVGR